MSTNKREPINPPGTEGIYNAYHFSQATRVGDTVWLSGQVGITSDMKPGKDMAEQARLTFENIKGILAAAGATMADVVEIMSFHTDLRGEMEEFAAVKDEYLPESFPSWTAVGVTDLALPELKVEVRVIAVIGSGTD